MLGEYDGETGLDPGLLYEIRDVVRDVDELGTALRLVNERVRIGLDSGGCCAGGLKHGRAP